VSIARFKNPQPSRTIGMVWRKTSPLAGLLLQLSKVVRVSADALREQQGSGSSPRKSLTNGSRTPRRKRAALNP
jgi:LysR family hydrogen peroxide-inducible transcriptional activator